MSMNLLSTHIDRQIEWYEQVIKLSQKELSALRMPSELKNLMAAVPQSMLADASKVPAIRIGKTGKYRQLYLITDTQKKTLKKSISVKKTASFQG